MILITFLNLTPPHRERFFIIVSAEGINPVGLIATGYSLLVGVDYII
jgi:hypothetical protein